MIYERDQERDRRSKNNFESLISNQQNNNDNSLNRSDSNFNKQLLYSSNKISNRSTKDTLLGLKNLSKSKLSKSEDSKIKTKNEFLGSKDSFIDSDKKKG